MVFIKVINYLVHKIQKFPRRRWLEYPAMSSPAATFRTAHKGVGPMATVTVAALPQVLIVEKLHQPCGLRSFNVGIFPPPRESQGPHPSQYNNSIILLAIAQPALT
jgi:hypothetical protein